MPPSNTSSPLSDAASLPNNEEDNDDDLNLNEAGPSRLILSSGGRQYTRSETSSTVQLGPKDDDSDLSDLSDEDDEVEGEQEEMGNDSDGNEEIGSIEEPELEQKEKSPRSYPHYRGPLDTKRLETPGKVGDGARTVPDGKARQTIENDRDTNSLSPPPPSTELKTQILPEVDIAEQGTRLEDDESDLESLTDSNEDAPPEADADEQVEAYQSESERPDEEDEEGEGDITMRAGDLEVEGEAEKVKEGQEVVDEVNEEANVETGEQEVQVEEETRPEEQIEEEVEEAPPSPALSIQPFRPHSSHPPPPTSAAVKALFGLEIKFAALRDRLYVERMEETAAEEEMILNGSHPAVSYLFKNLRARRERLHEVASRRHKQVLEEILKVKDENKEAVWTWWTEERDREQWEEFQDTWAKRRRLIREKSDLEGGPGKRLPKSWVDMPKPLDWAAGAVPAPMSAKDAASDLAKMDPRRNHPSIPSALSRQGSPQRYATPPTHNSGSSSFGPYTFHPEEGFQHPHYAQRVQVPPASHHTLHRIGQTSGPSSGPGSSQGQQGYGPAVFNEPRREGRTVPTSSALFDSGRRSNEGISTHQQVQAQAPPPAPGLGAELWGKDRSNGQSQSQSQSQGQGQGQGNGNGNGTGQGHSLVTGPNGRVGISNGTNTTGTNGNGNGNGNTSAETTNGHKDPTPPETVDQKPHFPGLTGFLSTQTQESNQQPAQGASGKIGSPPKSSLGITGIPSGMPFI